MRDVSVDLPEADIVTGMRQDLLSRASRRFAASLQRRTAPVDLDRAIVSFTFDDVPDSAVANGASLLAGHGVKGTFYIAAGLCGKRFGPWRFAPESAVTTLLDQGHEIGCHTYVHPDLQRLGRRAITADLDRNAQALFRIDPRAVPENFAYPYGSIGLLQKGLVERRFATCRGVRPGLNGGRVDLGQLKAMQLYDDVLGLDAVDRLIEAAAQARAWLVFYTHDVAVDHTDQGSSPAILDHAVRSALRAGCDVLNVRDAMARIAAGAPYSAAATASSPASGLRAPEKMTAKVTPADSR